MRHVTTLAGSHFLHFQSLDGDSDAKACLPARLSVCLVSRSRPGETLTHSSGHRNTDASDKWPGVVRSTTAPSGTCGPLQWQHLALLTRASPGPHLSHVGAV